MAKIISLIINFLNIIHKFSFKLECFLMNFLPNDPKSIIDSEPYKRFNVNIDPIIKPELLPISFDEAVEI